MGTYIYINYVYIYITIWYSGVSKTGCRMPWYHDDYALESPIFRQTPMIAVPSGRFPDGCSWPCLDSKNMRIYIYNNIICICIYIYSNPQNERRGGHLQKHGRNIIYNSLGEDKRQNIRNVWTLWSERPPSRPRTDQNIRKLPLLNVAMENHNFWEVCSNIIM